MQMTSARIECTAEDADLKSLPISRLIHVLRHYFGLSQEEIADEMGSTRITVARIETTPDTEISLDMLHRINFMSREIILHKKNEPIAISIATELERRSAAIIKEKLCNKRSARIKNEANIHPDTNRYIQRE